MRYAIFTDIHANLEALEAVLAKIDELDKQQPIDQIWFLGDLVGYGPNPNECIAKLRERTDVIIAGNHDWAAVGKIDLEDFSAAARISAEWTAEQLTEAHRHFLINLPERIEKAECTLVHGSPYGPLWEYLTSEILAERSFQYFSTRYCFVGHTHVPVIFQQPDAIANTPTHPLNNTETTADATSPTEESATQHDDDEETTELAAIHSTPQAAQLLQAMQQEHSPASEQKGQDSAEEENTAKQEQLLEERESLADSTENDANIVVDEELRSGEIEDKEDSEDEIASPDEDVQELQQAQVAMDEDEDDEQETEVDADGLNSEIEELLELLGLSQSMIQVTNEMVVPPEGKWQLPDGFRAIVNPGGVGQPRDGDPRAAFMIYDTERGFTFYRVPYAIEKTQEKIIKVGLPHYLAARLAYGR